MENSENRFRTWLEVAAHIDEQMDGPLEDPDIVASQGIYLRTRPDTPVYDWKNGFKPEDLICRISVHIEYPQQRRAEAYGQEIADAWPIGHTPADIKARYEEEKAACRARKWVLANTTSEDGSGTGILDYQPTMQPERDIANVGFVGGAVSITERLSLSCKQMSPLDSDHGNSTVVAQHQTVLGPERPQEALKRCSRM